MKISVYIATSVDGFIARENGDLDWLPGSDGETVPDSDNEDYGYNAFMESIDVLVMGRKTYESVISFGQWPYENKRVIVLSSTLSHLSENLPDSVELKSCPPQELALELGQSGAKHLYIDGGLTIQKFLDAGLIDEIIITTVPVLIGSGIPLFGPLHRDKKLQHIETRSYKNGFVQSKYKIIDQD